MTKDDERQLVADAKTFGGKKGWHGVDLDGTLAEYDGVYRGDTDIGEPIPKMVERVKR